MVRVRTMARIGTAAVLIAALAACSQPMTQGGQDEAVAGTLGAASIGFRLGSLEAFGFVSGLGRVVSGELEFEAKASSFERVCFNKGRNGSPAGFNFDIVSDVLPVPFTEDEIDRNGRFTVDVSTAGSGRDFPIFVDSVGEYEDAPAIPGDTRPLWQQYDCPNSNWTPKVTFVYWDKATIELSGDLSNPATYVYECVTAKVESKKWAPATLENSSVQCSLVSSS